MKKIYLLISTLSILTVATIAQNTSPYWSLAGNNNSTGTSKLGTTNAVDLRLFSNNAARLIIKPAGNIGIGTSTPNSSSLLDINSITKGLLIPRMTQAQRNAIASPAIGLMIFQTDVAPTFYWYTGTGWKSVGGAGRDLANLIGTTAINSSLLPASSGSIDLGNATQKWRTGNFSGTINAGSAIISNGLTVSGGGISGYNNAGNGVYGGSTSYNGIGVYGRSFSSDPKDSYQVGYGLYGESIGGYGVYGHSSEGIGIYGNGSIWGVEGEGTAGLYGIGSSYGLFAKGGGFGAYASGNIGMEGVGYFGVVGSSDSGFAVEGDGNRGFGGFFNSNSGTALFARTTSGPYAGDFEGNVYTTGSYLPSDKNLKENIKDFNSAMDIINKLQPKYYKYKDDAKFFPLHLPKGNHYGFIAQDLELVLPDLIKESIHNTGNSIGKYATISPDGKPLAAETIMLSQKEIMSNSSTENITIKAINYTELIPIMIRGMQEQQAKMQEQTTIKDKQIADLQNQINDLKSMILKGDHGVTSLSGYLKQNMPNPVNDNTLINYYVGDNTGKAEIRITDIKGSLLKVYNASKGENQLSIRRGDLPSGTYNYTLYIRDKNIDTKQMVIANY